ncbi:VPLPA-CTERM sorting domain-containing protein [Cereibacter sp. SYSU M97828]|nr:VPLPA-CTERM sorting domain-containing protein [Cereibacter flavus]
MLKIALAALAAAGISTMADAAVVTYTYSYAFDTETVAFDGIGDDGEGGSYTYSISRSASLDESGSFDISIDTDIVEIPGLTLTWYDDATKGLTTTLPGVGLRTLTFGADGMPEYWDLYVETTSETWNYFSGGDFYNGGKYVSINALGEAPFFLGLPDGIEGYGLLTTGKIGPGGTWSVAGGEVPLAAAAPLPTPLPASVLLLIGGIGALGLMRRGGRRA